MFYDIILLDTRGDSLSYGRDKWSQAYTLIKQNRYLEALGLIEKTRLRGKTHISAIRKLHEPIAKLCDRIAGLSDSELTIHTNELQQDLVRSVIVVRYQAERGLIDRDLASAIINGLQEIYKALAGKKYDLARDNASRLRIFLDSIIAFKYNQLK